MTKASKTESASSPILLDVDLRSPCATRSISLLQNTQVSNDVAEDVMHVLFGTERGSLHYRAYDGVHDSTYSSKNHLSLTYSKRCDESSAASGPIADLIAVRGAAAAAASSSGTTIIALLVDDNKGSSGTSAAGLSGSYRIQFLLLKSSSNNGSCFLPLALLEPTTNTNNRALPRASSLAYHPNAGFVCAAGTTISSLQLSEYFGTAAAASILPASAAVPTVSYRTESLPESVRTGAHSLLLICQGRVVVVSAGNSFYAMAGSSSNSSSSVGITGPSNNDNDGSSSSNAGVVSILSFSQSGQVHAPIVVELDVPSSLSRQLSAVVDAKAAARRAHTATIFLASGREFAACEVLHDPRHGGVMLAGCDTIGKLPSPILSAVNITGSKLLVAILTSDGLVHTRSPACIAVPLMTIELGTRPNDYFVLRSLPNQRILASSYSGDARVISPRYDSLQDRSDRLMRLSIDAFGPNNFPRTQLAEALSATFTATSYVGTDPCDSSRLVLKQYLEAFLGLGSEVGDVACWLDDSGDVSTNEDLLRHYIAGTALLCYACAMLSQPLGSLASRAAKLCESKAGVREQQNAAIIGVCENIADHILKMVSTSWSLISSPSKMPALGMEFVEASLWLLRCCGKYDRAIGVLKERMDNPNKSTAGGWSYTKYESYTARMLQELWSSGNEKLAKLVLKSSTTKKILEVNPKLGLFIFTANHPSCKKEWREMSMQEDPLLHPIDPLKTVERLKTVSPPKKSQSTSEGRPPESLASGTIEDGTIQLPLTTPLALAVTFLESVFGISSKRSPLDDLYAVLPPQSLLEERAPVCHDELAYLLLEGVISEKKGIGRDELNLSKFYQSKLRRFLSWPGAMYRAERILASLPTSFLREHALLLGRLGRHDEALQILYCDLKSLDLALKYCDMLHSRKNKSQKRQKSASGGNDNSCAYLPLVRVALLSKDSETAAASAIKIISQRRDVINRGEALRLLPGSIPLSAVARSFLIPALVESESEVRRLQIAASLLRTKYVDLKRSLTNAQITSQAQLENVTALQRLDMGDLIRSSSPFKGRVSGSPAPSFPNVMLVRHFFSRHLVIQAQISNTTVDARILGDVAFVIAESSDESAVTSAVEIPIKTLPLNSTGSAWCALSVVPQRLDGVVGLTCELRYTILPVDITTGAPLSFAGGNGSGATTGRTFVEELQDIDVRQNDFKYF